MELRYLRYFVAVARTRHFTQAAKELGISQPPLSQQIQRLEREVGTPLFRRLTRGVELTEAGESFYEDARQILAMSDAALEKAKGIARGMNGSHQGLYGQKLLRLAVLNHPVSQSFHFA